MKKTKILLVVITMICIFLSGCTQKTTTTNEVGKKISLYISNNYYDTVTLNVLINEKSVYYDSVQYGFKDWIDTDSYYFGNNIIIKAIVDGIITNTKEINDYIITISISSRGYPNIW